MTQSVNSKGQDWLLMKAHINEVVTNLQEEMLNFLPNEEYHRLRGAIQFGRGLIDWVEPTTPPQTREEDYGISDPNSENYA